MCGITGIIQKNNPVDQNLLKKMTDTIAHRGPDDTGIWVSEDKMVGLGHRRLSIIDLSEAGHQPMLGYGGTFAITFNGEIYNFRDIKNELLKKGYKFKSQTDTEVLLNSYIEWGEECLEKLNGMFAFAIWDEKEQKLFAARDRLGEKPFKYYYDEEKFVFASELKAIIEDRSIEREVDWQAIDLAFSYRYVPSPRTGFKNIKKLPAGHKLIWQNGKIKIEQFWSAYDFAQENFDLTLEEWKEKLWKTFRDSVKKRMISDVPVGVFLSGGLDSSSVVAAMSEVSQNKIKTFSVGFKDRHDSETPFAKKVAEKFDTDHTEIIIDPDILKILPDLIYQYEEPFFDNSAVPTMAMSQLTKEHVTVVLTGDGGDECFGGYPNHYFYNYLKLYQRLPKFLYKKLIPSTLRILSKIIKSKKIEKAFYRSELLSHDSINAYVDYYGILQKDFDRSNFYITKKDLYTKKFQENININLSEELMNDWLGNTKLKKYSNINRSILADVVSRLADNYLTKVDMASMLYALETRPPFLDHRLVELSLAIPAKFKIKGRDVKLIWKDIVKDKLPKEIIERKKMGFGIPIIAWMRDDIYDELKKTLLVDNHLMYEYINKNMIERLLKDHKSGKADYSNHIWSIWLLKLWLDKFFD